MIYCKGELKTMMLRHKNTMKRIFLLCSGLILVSCIPTASHVLADTSGNSTASFTVVAGTGDSSNNVNNGASNQNLTGTQTNTSANSNNGATNSSSSGNNSTLILQTVPALDFKTISAADVYNGDDIALSQSNQSTSTTTNRTLSVADYRGYSKNYRGWVVSAIVTPFSNGKTSISPSITLHFSHDSTTNQISPVTITSQNTSAVITSKTDPTQGAGISNIVSSVSTTLNFSSLTTKQLEKFKPGTYSGKIIWNLDNTAASND